MEIAQRQWCELFSEASASGLRSVEKWRETCSHQIVPGQAGLISVCRYMHHHQHSRRVGCPCSSTFLLNPRFAYWLLGPPCGTFSTACNTFVATMLRNMSRVEAAVVAWQGCGEGADRQWPSRRCPHPRTSQSFIFETFALEHPGSSLMLESSPYQSMEKETKATKVWRDQCSDGAPWRKSTCITSNDPRVGAMNGSCPGCPDHVMWQGLNSEGALWTNWPGFARSCVAALVWRCALLGRSGTRLAMVGDDVLCWMLANSRFSRSLNGSATSRLADDTCLRLQLLFLPEFSPADRACLESSQIS